MPTISASCSCVRPRRSRAFLAPQLEKAAKLAVALEVTLDELVGRDTPEVTEDVRDPKLRSSVRALEATGEQALP